MSKERVKRKVGEERSYIKLEPCLSEISKFEELKATCPIAVRVV
jgi:hypothetical protein